MCLYALAKKDIGIRDLCKQELISFLFLGFFDKKYNSSEKILSWEKGIDEM